MSKAMTLGELLTKIGYDHVHPQPSLVNAVLVAEDPLENHRTMFAIDLVVNSGDKLHLHLGEIVV